MRFLETLGDTITEVPGDTITEVPGDGVIDGLESRLDWIDGSSVFNLILIIYLCTREFLAEVVHKTAYNRMSD